jgi:hypothetical protein
MSQTPENIQRSAGLKNQAEFMPFKNAPCPNKKLDKAIPGFYP